jgi:hypothetical protein
MAEMYGDENGIALWNLMAVSNNKSEQEYFTNLNLAATTYGTIWFSDFITQMETKSNQTIWQMIWHGDQYKWEVIKFHVPKGAEVVTERIRQFRIENEIIELSADDIIIEE